MNPVILNLEDVELTDEQFYKICRNNENWKLERTAKGEIIIMSPVGGISGGRVASFIAKLWLWNDQTKLGIVFSSSTIFRLPKGGERSPDCAWISLERWQTLTPNNKKVSPNMPRFCHRTTLKTDSLKPLQEKMQEYLNSGLKLGWLINPQQQQVEIYRPNSQTEIRQLPTTLTGEETLPNFTLEIPQF